MEIFPLDIRISRISAGYQLDISGIVNGYKKDKISIKYLKDFSRILKK